MKQLAALFALCFCLIAFPSCKTDGDCETCPAEGTCPAAAETECAVCTELMAGGTGWCADCGVGFHEGQLVNCESDCAANPGGEPCAACVK
jgi:hypothetical protein